MGQRTYAFIDGESHFIRSEAAWQDLHGPEAGLDCLRYIGQPDEKLVLVIPKAKVFWTRKLNPDADRVIYFTSFAGDTPALHDVSVTLRNFGLEPSIIHELSTLAAQRQNKLRNQQLIEKPKGVDIDLAVQMLELSYNRAFDVCHLYSSDVDFLPVVRAIRARGIQVYVHGYRNGLAERSPLLHVPDRFIDLEEMLRSDCELAPQQTPPTVSP